MSPRSSLTSLNLPNAPNRRLKTEYAPTATAIASSIATDALVLGKKVAIAYEPGKVLITVYERDGSQHNSSLKWA